MVSTVLRYGLAGVIHPTSGASHHQLAVITRQGGCLLRVVYYPYRALATREVFPTARDNLESEIKKIETAQSKGQLLSETATTGLFMALFLIVHVQDFMEAPVYSYMGIPEGSSCIVLPATHI